MKLLDDKYIKIIKWIIVIVSLLVLLIYMFPKIIGVLQIGGIIPISPNYSQMEEYFNESYDNLVQVAKSLGEMDYDYIAIREVDDSNVMYTSNSDVQKEVTISDESLIRNIETLYSKDFDAIFMYHNQYIEFCRWSSLSTSKGIVYSLNDDTPQVEWAIEIRPLSVPNWFYYESSYEEWKMVNQ